MSVMAPQNIQRHVSLFPAVSNNMADTLTCPAKTVQTPL